MKIRIFFGVLLLVLFSAALIYADSSTSHFFNVINQPLPEYEPVYPLLKQYFADSVPETIIVSYTKRKTSQFNPNSEIVLISEFVQKDNAVAVVGHESSHLSLANLTQGASVMEQFRFFDEGFADIFESIVQKDTEAFKRDSLIIAALQSQNHNVSFKKVQNWSEYFGNPQVKTNFYAYPVGSSFDFFIIDTYGMEQLFAFFKDIGNTQDLEKSIKNVFKKDQQVLETDWLRYLGKVDVSVAAPQIIKFYPENKMSNISPNTSEIYIEFTTPMMPLIRLITSQTTGISYKDAYWKTPKILAVKVKLQPNCSYVISLGDRDHGRFLSKYGIALPVTEWSFTTGLE